MTRFSISQQPIDVKSRQTGLQNDQAGACAIFEGRIRNHNEGCGVERLDYEVFGTLAVSEGHKILEEAVGKFGLLAAEAVHREGSLAIGDCAVWVGVLAAHRGEAFQACRYIIDEIKHRLPIWKKEYRTDGTALWTHCDHGASAPRDDDAAAPRSIVPVVSEEDYYARQILLPDIGAEGQAKLKAARVLVVGAGGLGSAALSALAAAGIGCLGLIEFDSLEVSNLHRQTIYTIDDIGQSKAKLAEKYLRRLNPFIAITNYNEKASSDNLPRIMADYDIILDCTDNFTTKYLLCDASFLFQKTLIQASIYRFEGHLLTYRPGVSTACLRCVWPEPPATGLVGDCADVGVLGGVPAFFGNLQANEAIKNILGLGSDNAKEVFTFDLLTLQSRKLQRTHKEDCLLCGSQPSIHTLKPDDADGFEVVLREGDTRDQLLEDFCWLDIRDERERRLAPIPEALPVALTALTPISLEMPKSTSLLIICARGIRSRHVAESLRNAGWSETFSLKGGYKSLPQASVVANRFTQSAKAG